MECFLFEIWPPNLFDLVVWHSLNFLIDIAMQIQISRIFKRYNFHYFCFETCLVGTQWNLLSEAIPVSTHKAHFYTNYVFTYVFRQTGLSEQCRPLWVTACSASSGSTLFSTHPAIFRQHQVVNCTYSNFRTSMVRSWSVGILRVNTVMILILYLKNIPTHLAGAMIW